MVVPNPEFQGRWEGRREWPFDEDEQSGANEADAMRVFFAWERLRLLFNLLLIAVTVSYAVLSSKATHPVFWVKAVSEGVLANVCFCAGPVAEGYLCWLGVPRVPARWFVFVCGTVLAITLAIHAIQQWQLGGGFFS